MTEPGSIRAAEFARPSQDLPGRGANKTHPLLQEHLQPCHAELGTNFPGLRWCGSVGRSEVCRERRAMCIPALIPALLPRPQDRGRSLPCLLIRSCRRAEAPPHRCSRLGRGCPGQQHLEMLLTCCPLVTNNSGSKRRRQLNLYPVIYFATGNNERAHNLKFLGFQ